MGYLLFVSLLWAFSFGLIKGNLAGIDSNLVSFTRLAISLLVFLPFLRFRKVNHPIRFKLILIGVIQFGIMYMAYIHAFQYLKAYEVALFTIFTPIYVTLYAQFRQNRLTLLPVFTTILAVAGTGLVQYSSPVKSDYWIGFLFVQVSNLAFAVGQVEYKRIMQPLKNVKDQEVIGWLYLGGAAVTGLACFLWTDFRSQDIQIPQILTLLYLGAIASGLGFFIFNSGARKVDTGTLAILNNLKIPLTVAVSLIFFGEDANWVTLLAGGGIVAAALWLHEWITWRTSRQSLPA